MRKLFGTDGIRGTANLDPMTSEMAMQVGRAAAHIFMRRAGRHQIVLLQSEARRSRHGEHAQLLFTPGRRFVVPGEHHQW